QFCLCTAQPNYRRQPFRTCQPRPHNNASSILSRVCQRGGRHAFVLVVIFTIDFACHGDTCRSGSNELRICLPFPFFSLERRRRSNKRTNTRAHTHTHRFMRRTRLSLSP
ncbi:unnamed protein product, partial [Ectocarpus fasciculatus]